MFGQTQGHPREHLKSPAGVSCTNVIGMDGLVTRVWRASWKIIGTRTDLYPCQRGQTKRTSNHTFSGVLHNLRAEALSLFISQQEFFFSLPHEQRGMSFTYLNGC